MMPKLSSPHGGLSFVQRRYRGWCRGRRVLTQTCLSLAPTLVWTGCGSGEHRKSNQESVAGQAGQTAALGEQAVGGSHTGGRRAIFLDAGGFGGVYTPDSGSWSGGALSDATGSSGAAGSSGATGSSDAAGSSGAAGSSEVVAGGGILGGTGGSGGSPGGGGASGGEAPSSGAAGTSAASGAGGANGGAGGVSGAVGSTGTAGTDGVFGSGGMTASGGAAGSGSAGAPGSGGMTASGGAAGTGGSGGTTASGGTGGVDAPGGSAGTAGTAGYVGASGAAGAAAVGGAAGDSGAAGTAGNTNTGAAGGTNGASSGGTNAGGAGAAGEASAGVAGIASSGGCGDGIPSAAEDCDDGNQQDNDGCSSRCAVEVPYVCSGTAPSVCRSPVEINCGDGVDNDDDGLDDCADSDCALHCDADVGACGIGETALVYASTDVPRSIPDNVPAGVDSTIHVGGLGLVQRVVMRLDITHTWDSDLVVALFSPAAVSTDVTSDNGSAGNDYRGTLFNSACATSVTDGSPPFTGCFQPEEAFAAYVDGPAKGAWRLNSKDTLNGDSGTLDAWSLALCVAASRCGDAEVDDGEACDDGNNGPGDGCTPSCTLEDGFVCSGSPTVCSTICGDGILTGAEACDDGNAEDGDGCSSDCQSQGAAESEPNDTCETPSGSFSIGSGATGNLITASIDPGNDQDWFVFTVPVYADLSFETFDETGPGSCSPSTVIDTKIQLYHSDCSTAQSTEQDDGGRFYCSRLDPSTQPDAMRRVPPGEYVLRVQGYGAVNTFAYTLAAKYVAYCGNGIAEGSEECDGDPGCSPDCSR